LRRSTGKDRPHRALLWSVTPAIAPALNYALLDSAWDALSLQANIDAYLNAIPKDGWPVWVIGGHDKKRIASKIGQDQCRVLAVLAFTLRGTPFFFAGDEIGMELVEIPPERMDDPFEKLVPGFDLSRDPERTPMRWSASRNAGFTSGEPWLPLGPDAGTRNVESLQKDERSLLGLYRRLLQLRRREPLLSDGEQVPLRSRNGILAYKRTRAREQILVALNTVHEPRRFDFQGRGSLMLSSYLDGDQVSVAESMLLRPDEAVIIKLET